MGRDTMLKTVTKRTGFTVPYNREKIYLAIKGANDDGGPQMSPQNIEEVTSQVEWDFQGRENVAVEEIQDVVEQELMKHGFYDIAKRYITYRQRHAERRKAQRHLMDTYQDIFFADAADVDLKRDNANINTDASMGIMLKLGAEGAKHFVDNYVLEERFRDADKENYIHIHDKDFSLITLNCLSDDTLVSVKKGDSKEYVPFRHFDSFFHENGAEIVDVSDEGLETLSKDGAYTKIKKVLRRPQSSDILKIMTRDGKILRASDDHVFVTVDGEEKPAKNLCVGDELPVAVFPEHFLPASSTDINLIDLFDHNLESIYIENTDYVKENLPKNLRAFIDIRTDRYKQYKNSNSISFSLAEYKMIRGYADLDESNLKLTTRGSRNVIPAVIKADEKIGKYIGYILTEGSVSDYGITFSNKDEEILSDFESLQSSLFPDIKITRAKNASGVKILIMNSKLMRYLFEGAVAYKTKSSDIALASHLVFSNEAFTRGFVSAMIDGDGSIQSDGFRIRFTTTSEKASVQLQQMLDTMNVKSRVSVRESIGQKAVANGIETTRHYDTFLVDITGEDLNQYRRAFPDTIIVNRVQKKIESPTNHHRGRIVKIEREPFDGYVYDFETENHFFVSNGIIVHNCCQIDLLKLFHGGFSTGHGFLREPNSIRAYASLACIAIQSNQNDMFGGQSINCFDYAMAEGVAKSFRKAVVDEMRKALVYRFAGGFLDVDSFKKEVKPLNLDSCRYSEDMECERAKQGIKRIKDILSWILERHGKLSQDMSVDAATVYSLACSDVEEETHQAMEALIHNFNTLHSRAGAQVPFSSINYGMDTSPEGRLATREVLNAIMAGLGNGETAIFPISVFQLKAGVNYNPEDPNYDLFQQACKTSAKRLFPNFENLDAPYNLQYYKPGDYNSYVATMGCRTRVMSNVNGPEESGSRGNFAFVTINLPKLALEAKGDVNKFYSLFDKYISISHDYLLARLHVIEQKHVYNYPFLMGQGVWMGSENLKPTDSIKDVLKHASYSIGFCGLAECLVALCGHHHGESAEAQKLGLEIVGHLRKRTDDYTEKEHMNWSTFGTPAESTAGQFQRANQRVYGTIAGVTDRPYMTNSSHVPVYYPIKAIDKIRIEAPYHALENAGHIAYIEMDGDPTKNVKAFEAVVRAMHDNDMGYFSINHPVDRDPVCGYTGIIENECPHCHRKEIEHGHLVVPRMS